MSKKQALSKSTVPQSSSYKNDSKFNEKSLKQNQEENSKDKLPVSDKAKVKSHRAFFSIMANGQVCTVRKAIEFQDLDKPEQYIVFEGVFETINASGTEFVMKDTKKFIKSTTDNTKEQVGEYASCKFKMIEIAEILFENRNIKRDGIHHVQRPSLSLLKETRAQDLSSSHKNLEDTKESQQIQSQISSQTSNKSITQDLKSNGVISPAEISWENIDSLIGQKISKGNSKHDHKSNQQFQKSQPPVKSKTLNIQNKNEMIKPQQSQLQQSQTQSQIKQNNMQKSNNETVKAKNSSNKLQTNAKITTNEKQIEQDSATIQKQKERLEYQDKNKQTQNLNKSKSSNRNSNDQNDSSKGGERELERQVPANSSQKTSTQVNDDTLNETQKGVDWSKLDQFQVKKKNLSTKPTQNLDQNSAKQNKDNQAQEQKQKAKQPSKDAEDKQKFDETMANYYLKAQFGDRLTEEMQNSSVIRTTTDKEEIKASSSQNKELDVTKQLLELEPVAERPKITEVDQIKLRNVLFDAIGAQIPQQNASQLQLPLGLNDGRSRTGSMINSESQNVIGNLNLDPREMDKDTHDAFMRFKYERQFDRRKSSEQFKLDSKNIDEKIKMMEQSKSRKQSMLDQQQITESHDEETYKKSISQVPVQQQQPIKQNQQQPPVTQKSQQSAQKQQQTKQYTTNQSKSQKRKKPTFKVMKYQIEQPISEIFKIQNKKPVQGDASLFVEWATSSDKPQYLF
eukprot:403332435